jgi:uncharacterized membrane protein YgaE (UPF0421/DUF939 family)
MVVLALILIVVAVVATVGVIVAGPETATLQVFDTSFDTNTVAIFLGGVVTGALFFLALGLFKAGMRRSRQRRQEMRALRERQTESVRELEEEKKRLASEKEELAERLEQKQDTETARPAPAHHARQTPQP